MDLGTALTAGLWGGVAGSALLLGAAFGYFLRLPPRLVAAVTAFGSGVLLSALSFELIEDAFRTGGFVPMGAGFVAGAAVYSLAAWWLNQRGARHRKRSGQQQMSEVEMGGSGAAIAVGALLDGIPESVVIGVSLAGGAGVSIVVVVAIFLSNVPEALSSSAGMRRNHRSKRYVFGVWGGIATASAVAALAGYVFLSGAAPETIAVITALAAGAILAMVADTMIPEAFEVAHDFAGFITVLGFLVSFLLSRLDG